MPICSFIFIYPHLFGSIPSSQIISIHICSVLVFLHIYPFISINLSIYSDLSLYLFKSILFWKMLISNLSVFLQMKYADKKSTHMKKLVCRKDYWPVMTIYLRADSHFFSTMHKIKHFFEINRWTIFLHLSTVRWCMTGWEPSQNINSGQIHNNKNINIFFFSKIEKG